MLDDVKLLLKHFAIEDKLEIESVPCIQHTISFTTEQPMLSSHTKLEFKNRVRGFVEHVFNEEFYLYDIKVCGKRTVIVTVVEVKNKFQLEPGKDLLK